MDCSCGKIKPCPIHDYCTGAPNCDCFKCNELEQEKDFGEGSPRKLYISELHRFGIVFPVDVKKKEV